MDFQVYNYTIPVDLLPALFYGDYTGLSFKEEDDLIEFAKGLPGFPNVIGHWNMKDGEQYFNFNDVNGKLAEVCDMEYLIPIEELV